VAQQAGLHGVFEVDVVDLADIDVPLALPAASPKHAGDDYPRPAGMAALTSALTNADAFVVVTPEYNHSYPASLKAAIDWHFTQWAAKPVAFVSYGGAAGGRHAVLHLENVLTELHAVTVRDGLAFPNYFTSWQDGRPLDPGSAVHARTVLDQLAWWAIALRSAREAVPYPG
jgi:NAD(P)H-dependent FMN reductase